MFLLPLVLILSFLLILPLFLQLGPQFRHFLLHGAQHLDDGIGELRVIEPIDDPGCRCA